MQGDIKEFLKPTAGKLVLPALVALLLAYLALTDLEGIPAHFKDFRAEDHPEILIEYPSRIGQNYMPAANDTWNLYNFTDFNLTDPSIPGEYFKNERTNEVERMKRIKEVLLESANSMQRHSLDRYIYLLDPFYPMPCELYLLDLQGGLKEHPYCRFYTADENFKEQIGSFSTYRQLSISELFFNVGVIVLETFLLSCLIFYALKKAGLPGYAPHVIIFLLILLPLIVQAIIINQTYENSSSYILKNLGTPRPLEYAVIYCDKTKTVQFDKEKYYPERHPPGYIFNQKWKACDIDAYADEINKSDSFYKNYLPEDSKDKPFLILWQEKKN